MKLEKLLERMDYKVLAGSTDIEISTLVYDSRKVEKASVFVCISGAVSDAHDFIPDVVKKGAAAVVVEKDVTPIEGVTYIKVDNTRLALACMSAAYFDYPAEKIKTIGITGTKGKTTTTYMVRSILESAGIKTGLIGTIESICGDKRIPSANTTPESYRVQELFKEMVDEGLDAVVMEVSSQALMLHRVSGFTFDIGVFTNLEPDHIGEHEHKDFADYMHCKSLLFRQCRLGIFNGDDEHLEGIMKEFESRGLYVGSVVLTHYTGQAAADAFKAKLEKKGVRVYLHYIIEGYPSNINKIVSDEGFGKNEYIETTRPLVVVTAPGPGSGKMATCLSQLYHDNKRGIKSGYAKYETFPIWNIPLKHPINLAYEAATADLNDVNMIDPFHLEAYGVTTVNYNRDIEIFPVLSAIFEGIYGECIYKSPTDMGVNMAGNCIIDDEACCEASNMEIIRRYYTALNNVVNDKGSENEVYKIELLMKQAKITTDDRKVTVAANQRAEKLGVPTAAIELQDGTIITSKTSDLLGASAALLLNALKALGGVDHDTHLISPEAIEPIQVLKTKYLGGKNPRLHTDEVLIALSISALTDENAQKALEQLPRLKGCQVHTSVMLSNVDIKTFKKLGVDLTSEPRKERGF